MFVSIIQPVFNAEKFIKQTIQSILIQTHSDFEYILIDDGSVDNSLAIILEYAAKDKRIKILRHSNNKGYIQALKYGIDYSSSNYIFRIDSDDIVHELALENRVRAYFEKPNCVLVSSSPTFFSNSHLEISFNKFFPTDLITTKWSLLWGNPITHSSSFFSKLDYYNCGGYIEIKNMEDWDLWNKFQQKGDVVLLSTYDVFYRLHDNQSTKSNESNPLFRKQVVEIIKSNIYKYNLSTNTLDSDNLLWTFYLDTNLKDISLRNLYQSFKLYNYFLKEIPLFTKELIFFIFLHKLRMINRLNNQTLSYLFTFIFFFINFPLILFCFPIFTYRYFLYLTSRKKFFKNISKI
jgi:glycosyltransferase involved in cell wall biosynthesis